MSEATSFLALARPDVLVEVFSWITYDSHKLAWFNCLSPAVRACLSEDCTWRHLCKQYWFATDERLKDWPKLSPQCLYRALEQWTPLEGYYVFTPAFPWGLLVLIRIIEGHVTANVIRLVLREDGTFEEVCVQLFRIDFGEERAGILRSVIDVPWFGGAPAEVSKLSAEDMVACTDASELFPSRWIGREGLFTSHQVLRISREAQAAAANGAMSGTAGDALSSMGEMMLDSEDGSDGDQNDEEEQEEDEVRRSIRASMYLWQPDKLFKDAESARSRTEAMLEGMLSKQRVACDLALIRSPQDFVPQGRDFLGVRPGLYVGDYGHAFYGQYRTEVLLVEYLSMTPEQLQAELGTPSLVFARPQGEPAPEKLGKLQGIGAPITFMRGVKQCGDFHVPMGATTFVVACGPHEACEALADGARFPSKIENRATGKWEAVSRAWRGFGTLAAPGFSSPSWANGWLVQMQDDDTNGGHRFGFCWDRSQDAVVLQWLAAQDTCPFLQRAWLPEDLQ